MKRSLLDVLLPELKQNKEPKPIDTTSSQTIAKPIVMRSLQFAGKLALAARLVTTANAKNISQRIEQMETALDVYDNEILSVSNDAYIQVLLSVAAFEKQMIK